MAAPDPDPLEAWAAADPAGRDALLDLAEQGVALQPAAEVVIQLAHLDREHGGPPADHLAEQQQVEGAYQALLAQLRALDLEPAAGEPLRALLERHLALVVSARTVPPDGLGQVAGELVALRDRIRRTVPVKGRGVVTHVTKRL